MTDADKVKALRAAYDDAEAAYTTARTAHAAAYNSAAAAAAAASDAWKAYQAAMGEKGGGE